jgi:hypothetical protein
LQVYESGIKELQLLKEQLEADNGEGADESTALAGGGSQVNSLFNLEHCHLNALQLQMRITEDFTQLQ